MCCFDEINLGGVEVRLPFQGPKFVRRPTRKRAWPANYWTGGKPLPMQPLSQLRTGNAPCTRQAQTHAQSHIGENRPTFWDYAFINLHFPGNCSAIPSFRSPLL